MYTENFGVQLSFMLLNDSDAPTDVNWYAKALKAVASLAPDRISEFRGYYEPDPKRKLLGYGTYVTQDYLKNVLPNKMVLPDFDARAQALTAFFNQLTIFNAIIGAR